MEYTALFFLFWKSFEKKLVQATFTTSLTPLTFGGFTLSHQESPSPVFQTQQQPLRVSASDFAKVPPGEVARENMGHTRQGW